MQIPPFTTNLYRFDARHLDLIISGVGKLSVSRNGCRLLSLNLIYGDESLFSRLLSLPYSPFCASKCICLIICGSNGSYAIPSEFNAQPVEIHDRVGFINPSNHSPLFRTEKLTRPTSHGIKSSSTSSISHRQPNPPHKIGPGTNSKLRD